MSDSSEITHRMYALKKPGDGVTALYMNQEINLFGSFTNLIATKFDNYPVIKDEPVRKAVEKGSWLTNLLVGIAATVVLAGLAIATVATGGAALAAVALAGAAVGTGVVTVGVAITDKKNSARSFGEFMGQLVLGGVTGAAAGAMLYGLGVATPVVSQAVGLQASMWLGTSTLTTSGYD